MKYITLNELNTTIRNNIYKVPRDVKFIIGIPRSGMLVATIIAEFLNIPLIDIDSFCLGSIPTGGNRLTMRTYTLTNKVLVMDDTVYSGNSMKVAKDKLKDYSYNFIYGCTYLEGPGEKELDFYLEDVRKYTKQFPNVIYEWNVHHHWPHISRHTMYDIDGVFCVNPPDERNTEEYERYIKDAIPLFIPTVPIGKIVTYRLIKYQDITKQWLDIQGIRYDQIYMFDANSWEERNETNITPEMMKGYTYKKDDSMFLFIESDDRQAMMIHQISGKPVLCVETNYLYGGE